MKTKLLLLVFLISSSFAFSQTVIKDGQKVSGTWKKSKSPYFIEGEAIVPEGKTLKIKPGVEVRFKTGTNFDYRYSGETKVNKDFDAGFLRVEGKLIAVGTSDDFITFTSKSNSGYWGTIAFVNSKDNVLEYCKVEYSNYIRGIVVDDNATGSFSFIDSDGEVKNCIFYSNWVGLNCKQGSEPSISNCVFYANEYGIEANSDSGPEVINSIFWENSECAFINGDAFVYISYSLIQDKYLPNGFKDKGNNILRKDPNLKSDYTVSTSSACYKAGEDGVNIGLE